MKEWLANPAVQAGIAPFVAALVSAAILRRVGWYWAGAAVVLGYGVAVYLSTGFQIQPWTSTRKIVAMVLAAAALGQLCDMLPAQRRRLIPLSFISRAAALALWLLVACTRMTAVGSLVALPVGLGAALIGCGAQVYAKLPWYSLAILAAVPLLAHLVWLRRLPRAAQALLSLVAAALPAAAAVWFTFKETGAPPL